MTVVRCQAWALRISCEKAAKPRPSSSSRLASLPVVAPCPMCVSQPPTSTKPMSNRVCISLAMRLATASNPLMFLASRLAAFISSCMVCMMSLRTSKLSRTISDKAVLAYMVATMLAWRSSSCDLPSCDKGMLGTGSDPRKMMGICGVKAMGRAMEWSSSVAKRFKNPD